MFYEMATPTTYQDLKRIMRGLATDQEPTQTGQEIADAIVAAVTAPAINNRATWDSTKTKSYYEQLAKSIDDEETRLRSRCLPFDPDVDWEIDCGLMASLVAEFEGGNCDDLASYALDYGMTNFSECVLAFTQHDGCDHSFVLVYCKGDAEIWLADTWVARDRSIAFTKSCWCEKSDLNCRVMLVKVGDARTGVMHEWQKHGIQTPKKRKKPSYEYPRKSQTGAYRHESARVAQSGGLAI